MNNYQGFQFSDYQTSYNIWDLLLLTDDDDMATVTNLTYVAFAVKQYGIMICSFDRYSIGNSSVPILEC